MKERLYKIHLVFYFVLNNVSEELFFFFLIVVGGAEVGCGNQIQGIAQRILVLLYSFIFDIPLIFYFQ